MLASGQKDHGRAWKSSSGGLKSGKETCLGNGMGFPRLAEALSAFVVHLSVGSLLGDIVSCSTHPMQGFE
jgi:hypothetical protein